MPEPKLLKVSFLEFFKNYKIVNFSFFSHLKFVTVSIIENMTFTVNVKPNYIKK